MNKTLIFFAAFLVACAPAVPTELKSRMDVLSQDAATLNAMTAQGIDFSAFNQQLAKTRGDFDLASSVWPGNVAPNSRKAFLDAFNGWAFADALWDAKIKQLDNPVEPNINQYGEIVAYAGAENLDIETYPSGFFVKSYAGKKYLPFDQNISILLSIASAHYKEAQTDWDQDK
jgi:hypothetical protein